jgi:hypothetical protein
VSAPNLDPFPRRFSPHEHVDAYGPLDLHRLGEGRVRIRTADAGEVAAQAVLAWLVKRREVEGVDYNRGTGAIEVAYREPAQTAGAFLLNLRDRLFTLGRPPPPRTFRVALAHRLVGRARFRLEGANIEELLRLAVWLADQPGVQRASPTPAAASILVLYDASATDDETLLAAIAACDPREWPAAPPPPFSIARCSPLPPPESCPSPWQGPRSP